MGTSVEVNPIVKKFQTAQQGIQLAAHILSPDMSFTISFDPSLEGRTEPFSIRELETVLQNVQRQFVKAQNQLETSRTTPLAIPLSPVYAARLARADFNLQQANKILEFFRGIQ